MYLSWHLLRTISWFMGHMIDKITSLTLWGLHEALSLCSCLFIPVAWLTCLKVVYSSGLLPLRLFSTNFA